jgi:DNA-directed RNA polymerase subunit N (RpoN/RPB10)
MVLSVRLFSCEKPKQGKVIVSEYDFYTERVTKTGFELCAKGKVKNVGEVDVKTVAITGNCLSCIDVYKYDGSWINPPDTGKSAEQQPVISYIPIGEEKEFIIKNIAYAPTQLNQLPKEIPEKL